MKLEEAIKIVEILLSADGGCKYCAGELIKAFINEFPEYNELAKEAFKKAFGTEIEIFSSKKTKEIESKSEKYHLHGWDDEKIYFWDGEKEICVSEDEELYNHLLETCKKYFERKKKE